MLRVLVVDDDPDLCLLTRRLLTLLGCDSYEAKNGFDAQDLVKKINPDLVLLDIMMPLRDGYETCRQLRSDGYDGKIILVSALQEQSEARKTQSVGANAYIQKPITRQIIQFHLEHIEGHQRI